MRRQRPYLVHLTLLETASNLHLRAQLSYVPRRSFRLLSQLSSRFLPSRPLQNLAQLRKHHFQLKVIILGVDHQHIHVETYPSDSFGRYQLSWPKTLLSKEIKEIHLFETNTTERIEYLLGHFTPQKLLSPMKLIISDFDKTLVDTRYSTLKELFRSLTSSLDSFPTIAPALKLVKRKIREGFHPFVVSASPHFYEESIRDWLYQHRIYRAEIFLKDYRAIFSPFHEQLTPKDIRTQGHYKLEHILDILQLTEVPDELTLVGDAFESDLLIYLVVATVLQDKIEVTTIEQELKHHKAFKLNLKQSSRLLGQLYTLNQQVHQRAKVPVIDIHIRHREANFAPNWTNYPEFVLNKKHLVNFFQAS